MGRPSEEALDTTLIDRVTERAAEDAALSEQAKGPLLASLRGPEALEAFLAGEAPASESAPEGVRVAARAAFIESISVAGFRGVGPKAELQVRPGPGLTLVVGRNGSGKSSFAEALELLLTGNSRRWSTRSAVWKEGWLNLHHAKPAVSASFLVEGIAGPTVVSRVWEDGAALDEAVTVVEAGEERDGLDMLGWTEAVEVHRPFLSYNELGSMLDAGPAALFDALSSILGLEELVVAENALKDAIKARKKQIDEAKGYVQPLAQVLREISDHRAEMCVAALEATPWDLDSVSTAVVGGGGVAVADDDLSVLRALASLQAPPTDEVTALVESLRASATDLAELQGTEAARARQSAALLRSALEIHRDHGDTECPVCKAGTLDEDWRRQTEDEVARLEILGGKADQAQSRVTATLRSAALLIQPMPQVLREASPLGIDASDAERLWKSWSALGAVEDPEALADAMSEVHPELTTTVADLAQRTRVEVEKREDTWRPVAEQLALWLELARAAREAEEVIGNLQSAEKWMKKASTDIRNERFQPIAGAVLESWELLKMQSSVALGKIVLTGSGSQRKVKLDVTIDGVAGAALGVMSQGELHSLALSLFLPRATLPESPFRFVVIDDPVQSMDPARVDGLAKLLDHAAKDRQVIVFTHDDRLPRSCRLLEIPADVIEVSRRADSVVELRSSADPVKRYCDDAWAIAKSEQLDPAVASRIVGVFCRSAIEAALHDVLFRRRLSKGASYTQVETLLDGAKGLGQLMSLALFDDESKVGEIYGYLNRNVGGWATDTYKKVQEASHRPLDPAELQQVVTLSERLARGLVQLQ